MQPNDNIGYLLHHVASALGRQSDQVLQERLGIGFSQFKVLMILGWRQNLQQRAIADKLSQTEASVSRQIKIMQEGGLLRVSIVPDNRREHVVSLTPRGERLAEKATNVLNRYYSPLFSRLNDKQQLNFIRALQTIEEAL